MSFGINVVAGGRLDPPFMPTKTRPWIKGDLIQYYAGSTPLMEKNFVAAEDLEFLSVAVACSEYYPEDSWDLLINGGYVIETVFTKDLPEGIFFVALIPLKEGDTITFRFNNLEGIPKFVWFNYQFLK